METNIPAKMHNLTVKTSYQRSQTEATVYKAIGLDASKVSMLQRTTGRLFQLNATHDPGWTNYYQKGHAWDKQESEHKHSIRWQYSNDVDFPEFDHCTMVMQ